MKFICYYNVYIHIVKLYILTYLNISGTSLVCMFARQNSHT